MATRDHRKLDAYHRIRMEASLELARFNRRIVDEAYTVADSLIQEKLVSGEDFDGAELGREAAQRVLTGYLGAGEPQGALDTASDAD